MPFHESIKTSFFGRSDIIQKLQQHFANDDDTARAALIGMPGIGKTRLAIELAHGLRNLFPGDVFWLATEQTEQRTQQFYNIAKHLAPDTPPFEELAKQGVDFATLVRQAWPQGHPKSLWILDNLPEPDGHQSAVSWRSWCPVPDHVCALITSRREVSGLSSEQTHHLLPLSEDDAIQLLTFSVDTAHVDSSTIENIVEWTCYHPLTIETLNRALREKVLRFRDINPLIGQPLSEQNEAWVTDVLCRIDREDVREGALRALATIFGESYERLPDDTQMLARTLAHLGPDLFPIELVEAIEGYERNVLAILERRLVLTGASETSAGTMHRLWADFLRSRDEHADDRMRAITALDTLMESNDVRNPKNWPLISLCEPHVINALNHAPWDSEPTISLARWIGIFRSSQGRHKYARDIEEQAFVQTRTLLGEDHPDTLGSMNNLASTLKAMGDLQAARKLQESALEKCRKILGEDHPDTLGSMNNLASTLKAMGDLQGARELQESTLEKRRKILGEDHPSTLTSMNNLVSRYG